MKGKPPILGQIGGRFGNENRPFLPPRLINTLLPVLRSSYLMAYDYRDNRVITLKDRLVVGRCTDGIAGELMRQGKKPEEAERAIVRPLEPILSPSKISLSRDSLREIAADDLPALMTLSVRQSQDQTSVGRTAIRTVFGLSEKLPIRALGYLLPAIHLAEDMRVSPHFTSFPQIQFIFMEKAGVTVNNLNESKVKKQRELFIRLARNFIREHYPELSRNIVFATDERFLADETVSSLGQLLFEDTSIDEDILYQNATTGLGGRQNVKGYMLLHPLVHDVRFGKELFQDTEGRKFYNDPEILINIGGQTEKQFYRARQVFKRKLEEKQFPLFPTVQLFSSHRVTPYIKLDNDRSHSHDFTIQEALANPIKVIDVLFKKDGKDNLMKKDIELLTREYISGRYAFMDFLMRNQGLLKAL